jgi:hypothetical protein
MVLSSCSSVTIRTDQEKKNRSVPTFQKRFNYYWWGLKGEYKVNVREACAGKPVEQMQSVYTTSDFIYGLLSLGIYSPRTARVWCNEQEPENVQ